MKNKHFLAVKIQDKKGNHIQIKYQGTLAVCILSATYQTTKITRPDFTFTCRAILVEVTSHDVTSAMQLFFFTKKNIKFKEKMINTKKSKN